MRDEQTIRATRNALIDKLDDLTTQTNPPCHLINKLSTRIRVLSWVLGIFETLPDVEEKD